MTASKESPPRSASIPDSPSRQFLKGAKDTFPLIVGAVPFGIIFGTLAASAGISTAATLAMSLVVFAGASQFVCVSLVAAGAAWPMIVLTTFVVNLRHLLYSAAMAPYYRRLNPLWKLGLAFGLTDETFAVAIRRYQQNDGGRNNHYYNLGSMTFMYLNWNLCTLIGLTAGRSVPAIATWGLDFAMVATFIGMVIPYLVSRPMWVAVLVAAGVSLGAAALPHKLGLMVAAIAGVMAGLICDRYWAHKSPLSSGETNDLQGE